MTIPGITIEEYERYIVPCDLCGWRIDRRDVPTFGEHVLSLHKLVWHGVYDHKVELKELFEK